MKKTPEMNEEMLSDCNCLNCRIGRIEEQLNTIQEYLEINMGSNKNPGKSSKNKSKKK
jgi:hypothetical protein